METLHTGACFSNIRCTNIEGLKIRYVTYTRRVSDDVSNFWIAFCKAILTDIPFTAELTKDEGSPCIMWTLSRAHSRFLHTLLYLSFFRCIDEYVEIVQALYNEWGGRGTVEERLDELFTVFYQMHLDSRGQTGKYASVICHGADWNAHALVYSDGVLLPGAYVSPYAPEGSHHEPITLAQFRENLKRDDSKSVQSYFALP